MGFSTVVDNGFAGMGFTPEAAMYTFPVEMFLPGSDLTPIEKNINEVVDGLTKWEPGTKRKVAVALILIAATQLILDLTDSEAL